MQSLQDKIQAFKAEIEATTPKDATELETFRIRFLGAKGIVKEIFGEMKNVAKEQKKEAGQLLNSFKQMAEAKFEEFKHLQNAGGNKNEGLDITLPGTPIKAGTRHPLRMVENEIVSIFEKIGFSVATGPEIEDDWHNFTSLNMPENHTARDMQDTFYTTEKDVILRTHTSPGQIHAMEQLGDGGTKPIRVILPGMCYRFEQITPRSEAQFHQVEGLAIGRNIRMSDLKGTIAEFAKRMFKPDVKVRFRASYFPFTEPSMEVDAECFLCDGEGCRVCKYSGWLEIAGSGMVHPNVLRNGGYDPSDWSGFAFGMGPERITMLKHGIEDIRYFWGNDLRFLQQF